LKLTLKKCQWKNSLGQILSCTSKSQEKGTIVTETLKSHLYYATNKGVVSAVMDLFPEKGEVIASFGCSASESESSGFVWRRSVIGTFEKVNEERTSNHLIIKTKWSQPGTRKI